MINSPQNGKKGAVLEKGPSRVKPDGRRSENLAASVHEKVLRATASIALDTGFGKVTMEAIAKRAGMTKGGLLYHYPSKSLLLQKLLIGSAELARRSKDRTPAESFAIVVLIAAAEDPQLLRSIKDQISINPKTDPVQAIIDSVLATVLD